MVPLLQQPVPFKQQPKQEQRRQHDGEQMDAGEEVSIKTYGDPGQQPGNPA